MKVSTVKKLAMVSAMVLGIGLAPFVARAGNSDSIGVSVTTQSTITTSSPGDIDFKQWLVIMRSTDSATFTLDHTGTVTQGGTVTTSTIQNLNGTNGTLGTLSVDLPTGSANTVLQMSRTALGGTMGTGLAMTAVTYSTAVEGNDQAFPDSGTGSVPVTVVAGGTPEVVTFGGTITATATPADGVHSDTFNVSFAY